MFESFRSKVVLASTALMGSAMVVSPAFAQAIDVSAATDGLEQVGVAVAAIGLAMIAAIAAGIAYRWIVAYLAK